MFSYFRTADELMSQQEPEELPIQTDEVCPFCGRFVEWDGDQLYCEPCLRTWPDFHDLRFDRYEVKRAARKAAELTQRDEDNSGYADTVAAGLERWTR